MLPQKILRHARILTTIGILLTISGIIMLITSPMIFESIINSELTLTPNNKVHTIWQKTPIPLAFDFYLFNWTNPEELRDPLVKPRLQEIGPYRFQETKEKVDVVWHKNGTVSFRQLRKWYFDRENSVGDITDEITTLNVVAATASSQASTLGYIPQKGLSLTMATVIRNVHITKTVGEFLFDGYQDPLIDFARSMPKLPGVELPPFDRFGWFYLRNGSTEFDGIFNMGTGVGDIPLGAMDRWNNRTTTGFYDGNCGKVGGSAGEFWPPYIAKDSISLFSPDMCREVSFDFMEEVTVKGLKGYKYVGNERTMDNGTLYPENACFCGGECVPSGILNVSKCRYGSPGYISFPHFYLADPVYQNQFEGLNPQKDLHELSITLEPRTGIPLAVAARFQVNIRMTANSHIGLFSDVPTLYFPIIWFEQKVVIPDDMASGLHTLINLPFIGAIVSSVVIIIGILILTLLLATHIEKSVQVFVSGKQVKKTWITKEEVPLNENGSNVYITKTVA